MSIAKKFMFAVAIPVLLALGIFIDCKIFLHCICPTVIDNNTIHVELFGQIHEYQN